MVKVAVPLFADEVSPRFGATQRFLIATTDGASIEHRETINASDMPPWRLPEYLASLGVSKLICGGIHPRFQTELDRRQIEVIWGVIGPAEEALQAMLAGVLRSDQFVCSGRGGRGRRRWRHGRNPGAASAGNQEP